MKQESFISKAELLHGDAFDYSKVKYLGHKIPIVIIDNKTREEFEITPENHLQRKDGKPPILKTTNSINKLKKKAEKKYNNRYDYTKFTSIKRAEQIFCKYHHYYFKASIKRHLEGKICSLCELDSKIKPLLDENHTVEIITSENSRREHRVKIYCLEHSTEEIISSSTLNRNYLCSVCKRQKDFEKKVKEVHGDKYDISKVVLGKTSENITVTCKKDNHGEFEIIYNNFVNLNQGCPKCSKEKRNIESYYRYIEKLKDSFLFNFGPKEQFDSTKPQKFTCKKNNHTFSSIPRNVSQCPICLSKHIDDSIEHRSEQELKNKIEQLKKKETKTIKDLQHTLDKKKILLEKEINDVNHQLKKIKESKNVKHIKVSKTYYLKAFCEIHKKEFFVSKQMYNMSEYGGCPDCKQEYLIRKGKKITKEVFLERAIDMHGDTYSYDKVEYFDNMDTPVTIICKEHGPWEQKPRHHLRGQGCPICAVSFGLQGNNERKLFIPFLNEIDKNFIPQYPVYIKPKVFYYVDAYYPKYNLAIEYDEPDHKYKIEEDAHRQNLIEQKLKCKFIRVDEDIFLSNKQYIKTIILEGMGNNHNPKSKEINSNHEYIDDLFG
jgi:hypothetical protein